MINEKKSPYIFNVLIDQEGDIFISKRDKRLKVMPDLWQTVCEKSEKNESSIKVCERETDEETGLKMKVKRMRKIFNNPEYNCDIYITKLLLQLITPTHQKYY